MPVSREREEEVERRLIEGESQRSIARSTGMSLWDINRISQNLQGIVYPKTSSNIPQIQTIPVTKAVLKAEMTDSGRLDVNIQGVPSTITVRADVVDKQLEATNVMDILFWKLFGIAYNYCIEAEEASRRNLQLSERERIVNLAIKAIAQCSALQKDHRQSAAKLMVYMDRVGIFSRLDGEHNESHEELDHALCTADR